MSRASETILEELHNACATALKAELERYNNGAFSDDEGNPKPIPANLLATVIRFLKDNGVDRPENAPDPNSDLLDPDFPEFDED
jgi:hypothetical protein